MEKPAGSAERTAQRPHRLPPQRRGGLLARGLFGLLLLPLAACSTLGTAPAEQRAAAAPAVARPADPLALFAAQAQPGERTVLAPSPNAAPVPVRVARAYNSGGGRQCRELALGTGQAASAALYCEEPGGWVPVRPLLQGGALARP